MRRSSRCVGGSLVADPVTHFLYPGVDGFEQAGGYAGPQVPWNKNINGNLSVAEKYMKAAGYPSGKYTGNYTVQVVGTSNGNDPAVDSADQHRPDAAGLQDPRQPGGPVGHVLEVLRCSQAGDRCLPDWRLDP